VTTSNFRGILVPLLGPSWLHVVCIGMGAPGDPPGASPTSSEHIEMFGRQTAPLHQVRVLDSREPATFKWAGLVGVKQGYARRYCGPGKNGSKTVLLAASQGVPPMICSPSSGRAGSGMIAKLLRNASSIP
jgi:hypothetical protein